MTGAPALVSTEWLADQLGAPDFKVIDGTWHMPMWNRDAHAEYRARHIPGAVFFDIDLIADTGSPLPHMLPSAETFSARVRDLGLGNGTRIVVYDSHGIMSAPRVWWMFRVFGHENVSVLDGGLPKWLAEARPVESGEPTPPTGRVIAPTGDRPGDRLVRDRERIAADLGERREQVVDARAAGRFTGDEEEVWPGRRRGHIPGALNLPFTELVAPATKTMLPRDRLAERVRAAGVDLSRPVVTSCGSGITACVVALALHQLGRHDVAVYDGSWAEWGLPGDLPVETGPGSR
ncbi:MAG TPA: 3-mercaptopyruvate sulfurtransferase [Arenibaculum sp.]|nr:3-mercaptopyruvate sulfurtransferase [Arenibaculum sp.]